MKDTRRCLRFSSGLAIAIIILTMFVAIPATAQISGPAVVEIGSTHTYTFTGTVPTTPTWTVIGGTKETSTSTTVTVTWNNTPTLGSVQYKFKTTLIDAMGVEVASRPITPTVTGATVCDHGSMTLYASSSDAGVTFRWYNAAGSILGTGPSFTTPDLYATQSYWADASNDAFASSKAHVQAIVIPLPTPPTTGESYYSGCGPSSFSITPLEVSGDPSFVYTWYDAELNGNVLATTEGAYETDIISSTTSIFFSRTIEGTTCESARTQLDLAINPMSTFVAQGSDVSRYGEGDVTLAASNGPYGYHWYDAQTGGVFLGSESTLFVENVPATTSYFVTALNEHGCEGGRTTINAIVLDASNLTIVIEGSRTLPGYTVLSVPGQHHQYQWMRNSTNLTGETDPTYRVTEPGDYAVRLRPAANSPFDFATPQATIADITDQDQNLVSSVNILLPNFKTASTLGDLDEGAILNKVVYYDDIGRPLQEVAAGFSPAGKDLVLPIQYDEYGRQPNTFLPFATSVHSGLYAPDALEGSAGEYVGSAQYNFYQEAGNVAHDVRPFSTKIFEASPLEKVLKTSAPGHAWAPAADVTDFSDRTIKNQYKVNTLLDNVIRWTYDHSTGLISAHPASPKYAPNTLLVTHTFDEHNNLLLTYENSDGQVILKRMLVTDVQSPIDDRNFASTYYIYDDLRNLVTVLPPEAVKLLQSQYSEQTDEAKKKAFLTRWAFWYKYDSRKRMIEKRVPGADTVYMVYDDRDRLVLTQDGNQRLKFQWSFTKYDLLNRPILTGIKDTAATPTGTEEPPVPLTQSEMQAAVNAHYAKPGAEWGESYDDTEPIHGYTNKTYPVITSGAFADPHHYLTVTYYDDYEFRSQWLDDYTYSDEGISETVNGTVYEQPDIEFLRVKGKVTGSKVKVLDGGERGGYTWLKSVNYYDNKYSVIQSVMDNYKGGQDRTTTLYDFTGKVLKSKTEHTTNEIRWKELVNAVVVGNSLVKTKLGLGWNAGAVTAEQLPAGVDGWIECVISEPDMRRAFGLTEANEGELQNTIDYGFWHDDTQGFFFEDTNNVYDLASPVESGDVVRIERSGTAMRYYLNGQLMHTTYGASSAALIGDASINTGTGNILLPRASFNSQAYSVQRRFIYDHAGRLTEVWHGINGQPDVRIVSNQYNELGEIIDKKLHSSEAMAADAHQSIDYRYNIRGWLTKMNETNLSSGDSGDPADYFSFQLAYDEIDSGLGNDAFFNGNISAMKWSTNLGLNEEQMNAYIYDYDSLNRIKSAAFKLGSVSQGMMSWATPTSNSFSTSNYQYDLNGNILALTRKGKAGDPLDVLTYDYGEDNVRSNQLLAVTDAGSKMDGFSELLSVGNDYVYDSNGNLVWDQNKGGEEALKNGDFSSGGANWVVSDAGSRLTFQPEGLDITSHTTAGASIRQNDIILQSAAYVVVVDMVREAGSIIVNVGNGGNTYINTSGRTVLGFDSLGGNDVVVSIPPSFSGHINSIEVKGVVVIGYNHLNLPEYVTKGLQQQLRYIYDATGRKISHEVYGGDGSITKKSDYVGEFFYENDTLRFISHEEGRVVMSDASPEYQYNLKDHLGNVRMTFTTVDEVEAFTATGELSTQVEESNIFSNYSPDERELFNHTDGGIYAQLLHGGHNSQVAWTKSLSVMPGDTIKAEVYAKYQELDNPGQGLTGFAVALTSAFGLNGQMAGDPGMAFDALDDYGTLIADGFDHSIYETAPKAYLNVLLFDRDHNFVDAAYGQIGINDEQGENLLIKDPHGYLNVEKLVTKPGYAYIFLSNENPTQVDVYFDDLKITHVKSPVVQMDDYYPFGLTFNSYQRENSVDQKYLYNGKELQDELQLGWLDYGARMYMPDIGRWGVVDPAAEITYLSPFNYTENTPLNRVDPTGMFSTHTDQDGNVVAVYDDGDLGVYKHDGDGAKAKQDVEANYSETNTSANGQKQGESLHALSFADQNVYHETGNVVPADIAINFGSTELTEAVQEIVDEDPSLMAYADRAGTGGSWDLKSKYSNGSLLYGKYASPRDAGNFAAGAVAQMSGISPVAQFGFGAYNLTGNNKLATGAVTLGTAWLTRISPLHGLAAAYFISRYGEDELSQRSIDLGKDYIQKNR